MARLSRHNSGIRLDKNGSGACQPPITEVKAIIHSGADAVIICYNLNDQDSFNSLNYWLQEMHTQKIDELSTVLVGCKKDLDI